MLFPRPNGVYISLTLGGGAEISILFMLGSRILSLLFPLDLGQTPIDQVHDLRAARPPLELHEPIEPVAFLIGH